MTHQLSPQQTQLVKQDQLHVAKVGLKGLRRTVASECIRCWRGPPDTCQRSSAGNCQFITCVRNVGVMQCCCNH